MSIRVNQNVPSPPVSHSVGVCFKLMEQTARAHTANLPMSEWDQACLS